MDKWSNKWSTPVVIHRGHHLHPRRQRGGTSQLLAAVGPQAFYLAVDLVQGLAYRGLEPHAPVVGEVARESPCLFEEHARVLQLG
jgi:hypothetical protein